MPAIYSWTLVSTVSTPGTGGLPPSPSESSDAYIARDLLLDDSGDLAVVGGSLVIATGAAAVAQAVRCELLTFRGEWFLDLDYGVPYFDEVLVKNPNLPAIAAMFREKILSVAGVLEIVSFSFDYLTTRELRVSYAVSTDFGELRAVVEVPV